MMSPWNIRFNANSYTSRQRGNDVPMEQDSLQILTLVGKEIMMSPWNKIHCKFLH